MALEFGLCISGWTKAAASKTERSILFILAWMSSHLTAIKLVRQNKNIVERKITLSGMDIWSLKVRQIEEIRVGICPHTFMFLFKFLYKFWCVLVIQYSSVHLKAIS